MLYSRIKYGSIVFGLTNEENLNKVQILQNKLLKVLSNRKYRYSTSKLYNELDILKFKDIVNQEIITFVFNYIKGNLPDVFENYFDHRFDDTYIMSEEKRFRLPMPIHRTKFCESNVRITGTNLFNKIECHLNFNISTKCFKIKNKNILMPYSE